jgi:hypothetical protein
MHPHRQRLKVHRRCSTIACEFADSADAKVQMFTVKLEMGVLATSYSGGDRFFIDPFKLLPLERFLSQPKGTHRPFDAVAASHLTTVMKRFSKGACAGNQ